MLDCPCCTWACGFQDVLKQRLISDQLSEPLVSAAFSLGLSMTFFVCFVNRVDLGILRYHEEGIFSLVLVCNLFSQDME